MSTEYSAGGTDEAIELERHCNNYKADFLWPHESGSVEEAGYEFVNASTEIYRKEWWDILLDRARKHDAEASRAND